MLQIVVLNMCKYIYIYILIFRVLVGAVNACVITILNYAYKYLSVLLVNWENHRYEQQWDDSYCTKNFALQFVNTYISLFATVLYDKDLEKLAINLASILVVKQFSMNLLEILFPKFKYKFQLSRFTKKWKTKPDQKVHKESVSLIYNFLY